MAAFAQLRGYHEPRYLHQTVVLGDPEGDPEFYEDLPEAIKFATTPAPQSGEAHRELAVAYATLRDSGRALSEAQAAIQIALAAFRRTGAT